MIISVQTRRQRLSSFGVSTLAKALPRRKVVRRKKLGLRFPAVALYASAFVAIVTIIAAGYGSSGSNTVASVDVTHVKDSLNSQTTSVNEVVATVIAANVAETTQLPVAAILSNRVISVEAANEVAATAATDSVSKQQIILSGSDRRELTNHTVKSGETLEMIARSYGISEDTIRWVNNLTSDSLASGKELVIPPVDGVVYTVKSGDTVDTIAERYEASHERIVAFNDLELSGLQPDSKIVIPAGRLPETERPGYSAPARSNATSSAIAFRSGNVGNRYYYGWCTWYAYERRPDIGSFWGDAKHWAASARASGYTVVQGVPKAGSIFQYGSGGYGGYYGHVGIVESVNEAAGTMVISDMNGISGWGRVGTKEVAINRSWNYIY